MLSANAIFFMMNLQVTWNMETGGCLSQP
jgi:hypothetical protein